MSKLKRFEQYQDFIARLFPEYSKENKEGFRKTLSRTVTFQVTDRCSLCCKYCYQINKGTRRMSFDTAKKFIDLLLSGEKGMKDYVSPENSPAIVLEFIGGEPLLEVELIEQICDYFFEQVTEMQHPWATKYMISICSNGVAYFDPKVQRFLNKHKNHISFSITIDGNKELHDSCRVFPDGSGSYDVAVAGAKDWMNKGYYMGSKITIAPGNLPYLYDAIVHMVELGYKDINANVVYEKGWEKHHAVEYYKQLIKIADYFLDNNLVEDIYLALFEDQFFKPMEESDNDNWCGGNGFMLSCDPDGYLYPCIRYMESSLGTKITPYRIGNVNDGISTTPEEAQRIKCLQCITRRSQSTDECFYCPIAKGCSWCTAYNYQETGSANKRVTYICEMHKARALVNAYFWSQYYYRNNIDKQYEYYVPDQWALKIIEQDELDKIKTLPNLKVMNKENKEKVYEDSFK